MIEIRKYVRIEETDINKFNLITNIYLEIGYKIQENSHQIINDNEKKYSHQLIFDKDISDIKYDRYESSNKFHESCQKSIKIQLSNDEKLISIDDGDEKIIINYCTIKSNNNLIKYVMWYDNYQISHIYYRNSNKILTGSYVEYYDNGQIRSECEYYDINNIDKPELLINNELLEDIGTDCIGIKGDKKFYRRDGSISIIRNEKYLRKPRYNPKIYSRIPGYNSYRSNITEKYYSTYGHLELTNYKLEYKKIQLWKSDTYVNHVIKHGYYENKSPLGNTMGEYKDGQEDGKWIREYDDKTTEYFYDNGELIETKEY